MTLPLDSIKSFRLWKLHIIYTQGHLLDEYTDSKEKTADG